MASKSQQKSYASVPNRQMMSSKSSKKSHMSTLMSKRSVTSAVNLNDQKMEKLLGAKKFGVTILDEDGKDVTPKPLYIGDGPKSQALITDGQSQITTDGAASFQSLFQTATQSVYAQPFSKSVYNSRSFSSMAKSSVESSQGNISDMGAPAFDDVTTIYRKKKEVVTEEDLQKVVHVNLEETETIWFFKQDGTSVSVDDKISKEVLERNKNYDKLCAIREGNDLYGPRAMQTFNFALKNKDVQASKVGMNDVGTMVTTWDMYDTYQEATEDNKSTAETKTRLHSDSTTTPDTTLNLKGKKVTGAGSQITNTSTNQSQMSTATSFMGFETTMSLGVVDDEPPKIETLDVEAQWSSLMAANTELLTQLTIMERIVTENIYQPKLALYRGLPVYMDVFLEPVSESEENEEAPPLMEKSSELMGSMLGPFIDRLWVYNCPLTQGKNISCFSWNKHNPDIVAVGYGSFNFAEQNKVKYGLACCWNLKNLEYPERVYECNASVSALDFSTYQPNLLAVGCTDGTVCLFNVRDRENQSILDCFDCPGKHAAAVWQLRWIERENHANEKTEKLISVAADGRVVEWSIRKGLECADLMKLKRSVSKPNPQAAKKKEKPEAVLARQAPGMSFAFHPKDTSVYLAGTEEGLIHKCSCQYNEQFLDTYVGHSSSVYRVKWSPFNHDVFLSCGADWSIKLWEQHSTKPIMSMLSTTKAVHDISWSPYSSTVFCAVNEGAIELWDLATNTLDPVLIKVASKGIRFSSCTFAMNSNSIVIGDTDGNVTFYQLNGIGNGTENAYKGGTDSELHKIISTSFSERQENPAEGEKAAEKN